MSRRAVFLDRDGVLNRGLLRDGRLVPPHGVDELAHPDAGIYMVGMKSYGRAPTFLLRTGYEQVRSVAAALAGDWESAREVDFVLPETGVCNGPAAACCGDGSPHEELVQIDTVA